MRKLSLMFVLLFALVAKAQTAEMVLVGVGMNCGEMDIVIDYTAYESRQCKFEIIITPYSGTPPTAAVNIEIDRFDTPSPFSFNPAIQLYEATAVFSETIVSDADYFDVRINYFRKTATGTWEYLDTTLVSGVQNE